LQESEIRRLSLGKGSLSDEERLEIESHVIHSYNFLIQIPWSSDLANIPDIVYAHHERLNGVGYPRKLVDHVDEIPIQSKILAITDIYDALVSVDRPYKKAIPQQRALAILEAEVREGKLDPNLFRIFLEARICEMVRYPDSEVA
jgi:HD-GYP domain-containing protein (c-di-GMP phosphodiesterase class II)